MSRWLLLAPQYAQYLLRVNAALRLRLAQNLDLAQFAEVKVALFFEISAIEGGAMSNCCDWLRGNEKDRHQEIMVGAHSTVTLMS